MKKFIRKNIFVGMMIFAFVAINIILIPEKIFAANDTTLQVYHKGESAVKHYIMLKVGNTSDKLAFKYKGNGSVNKVEWSSSDTAIMKVSYTEGTKENKVCKITGIKNGTAKLQLEVKVKLDNSTYKTYNESICISVWNNIGNRWGRTKKTINVYRGASYKDYEVSAQKGTISINKDIMLTRECKDYYFVYADYEGENNGLKFSDGTNFGFIRKSDVQDHRVITYNDNGGQGGPVKQETLIRATDNYPKCTLSLTLPYREGYAFAGWSIEQNRTNSAIYSAGATIEYGTNDITYYAVWKKSRVSFPLDTYKFANAGYKMSVEQFKRMFGSTQGQRLYELYTSKDEATGEIEYPGEGGLCYGFSETIGSLAANGINKDVLNTQYIKTLDWNSKFKFGGLSSVTIKEHLQYGWAYQLSATASHYSTCVYDKNNKIQNYTKLVDAVRDYESNKGDPVNIGIYGNFYKEKEISGHSVLAMYIADDNEYITTIAVYDSNYPKSIRYLVLSKKNGHYTQWSDSDYNLSTNLGTATYLSYNTESGVWKQAFTIVSNNGDYSQSASWVQKSQISLSPKYLVSSESLNKDDFDVDSVDEVRACGKNSQYKVFWVDDEKLKLNNVTGNVSVAGEQGIIKIKSNQNSDIELKMTQDNILEIDSSKVYSIEYSKGDKVTTLKFTGNDMLTIDIDIDKVIVNNARDTIVKATIEGHNKTIDNNENYILKMNDDKISVKEYNCQLKL